MGIILKVCFCALFDALQTLVFCVVYVSAGKCKTVGVSNVFVHDNLTVVT